MNGEDQQIGKLHGVYGELTKMPVRLDFQREREWFEWQRRGFGEAELRLVIGYLQREIRKGDRKLGALKFSNLIGQPDRFEEDLGMARATGRVVKVESGRVAVMRGTGRAETQSGQVADLKDGAKSVGQVAGDWKVKWEAMKRESGLRTKHDLTESAQYPEAHHGCEDSADKGTDGSRKVEPLIDADKR